MEEKVLIRSMPGKEIKKMSCGMVLSIFFAWACVLAYVVMDAIDGYYPFHSGYNDEGRTIINVLLLTVLVFSIVAISVFNRELRTGYLNLESSDIIRCVVWGVILFFVAIIINITWEIRFWAWIVGFCVGFVLSLILFVVHLSHKSINIKVTETEVCGEAIFGKKVRLPIEQISTYGTRDLFSTVFVCTSTGFIRFPFVKNYKEIEDVLRQIIQDNRTKSKQSGAADNGAQNLKAYKDLLDSGVITQEEFEQKKKQILGL